MDNKRSIQPNGSGKYVYISVNELVPPEVLSPVGRLVMLRPTTFANIERTNKTKVVTKRDKDIQAVFLFLKSFLNFSVFNVVHLRRSIIKSAESL